MREAKKRVITIDKPSLHLTLNERAPGSFYDPTGPAVCKLRTATA